MQTHTDILSIPDSAKNCVLVIGNFDGVHRGHRALIDAARDIAKDKGKKTGVLTFEPHPRALFRPDDPPFRLSIAEVKTELLQSLSIDHLFIPKFDWDFASMTAPQFIEKTLKDSLSAAHLVIGKDFCFGQLRHGNAKTLEESGIPVTVLDKVVDDDDGPLSSSAVRMALRAGDIDLANGILGWEWEVRGLVQVGDRRGRELGYPTANVRLGDHLHPSYGVYATRVQIMEDGPDSPWLPSATNIGIRPMFALPVGQVEAHIFDFDRDIYGKTLRVRPVKRLRGEAKFDSLDALIAQIERDCDEARAIL